jgi:hypothetical protein
MAAPARLRPAVPVDKLEPGKVYLMVWNGRVMGAKQFVRLNPNNEAYPMMKNKQLGVHVTSPTATYHPIGMNPTAVDLVIKNYADSHPYNPPVNGVFNPDPVGVLEGVAPIIKGEEKAPKGFGSGRKRQTRKGRHMLRKGRTQRRVLSRRLSRTQNIALQ